MIQHIRIDTLMHEEVRRDYQAAVERKCEEARAKGYMSGEDVEKAWNELKEGILGAASRVCRTVRMRRGEKRSRWWNEVRELVRKRKLMYRRLLDTGTEDAIRHYNKGKIEAKRVVRRARNAQWLQLEKELEKDAWSDQRRSMDSGKSDG